MTQRADAHIHLFKGGYQGESLALRPGVTLDEPSLYASLAKTHRITAALVVGYAAEPWAQRNNDDLAEMARVDPWIRPVGYVDLTRPPSMDTLERRQAQGFVGMSFYISNDAAATALRQLPDALWQWVVRHRWLISVNARGEFWRAWRPILERHDELRLLISHLGLPPRVAAPPSDETAAAALEPVLELANFAQTHVKLSGFYALSEPGYAYPHAAVWPYVQALVQRFGVERCVWGSDFSPHLDNVSFPQTFGLFTHMPFLSEQDRGRIEGLNLLSLLNEVM